MESSDFTKDVFKEKRSIAQGGCSFFPGYDITKAYNRVGVESLYFPIIIIPPECVIFVSQ